MTGVTRGRPVIPLSELHLRITQFGFEWGSVEVTRRAVTSEGHAVLAILTSAGVEIEIRVSAHGENVQVRSIADGEPLLTRGGRHARRKKAPRIVQ